MLCVAKLHITNVATMFFLYKRWTERSVSICNLWETKIIIRVGEKLPTPSNSP